MVDYRDPKNPNKMNFAKPVVDIAASSRSQAGAKLASWGCSLTDDKTTTKHKTTVITIKHNKKKKQYNTTTQEK